VENVINVLIIYYYYTLLLPIDQAITY